MSEMPAPSAALIVQGAVLRYLESREPGAIDAILAILEDEEVRSEVIRLRGPKLEPLVKESIGQARTWVAAVRAANRGIAPKKRFGLFGG
jgi:hypothetical protein